MKFVVEDAAEIIIKAEVTKVVDECNTDDDEVFRPWFGPDPLLTASEVALEWLIEIKDRKLKSYEAFTVVYVLNAKENVCPFATRKMLEPVKNGPYFCVR